MSPAAAKRRLLLGAAAACLFTACGPDTRTPEARGKAAFASFNCKQCHRVGAEGGTLGPDLSFVGFRKSAPFLELWLSNPRGWQPSTQMPDFGFTERGRKDIVAYLSTLRGQAYAADKPWDAPALKSDPAARGRELYVRTGCGSCHGAQGQGGFHNNNVPGGLIPALRETASTYTKAELERKIKAGVAHPQKADPAGAEPMLAMPAWGEVLDDGAIAALADYLLTLKPTKDNGF